MINPVLVAKKHAFEAALKRKTGELRQLCLREAVSILTIFILYLEGHILRYLNRLYVTLFCVCVKLKMTLDIVYQLSG